MTILDYSCEIVQAFVPTVIINTERASKITREMGTVFTCGNGGSSTNASHFTQDLMKACNKRSICMTDNYAYSLAIANDANFSKIFSSYLTLNADKGDVLFCISGSGNSQNLLDAVWEAKRLGVYTISLVGFDGGKLKEISDLVIHTAMFDMRQAESAHSIVLHYIIESMGGKK